MDGVQNEPNNETPTNPCKQRKTQTPNYNDLSKVLAWVEVV